MENQYNNGSISLPAENKNPDKETDVRSTRKLAKDIDLKDPQRDEERLKPDIAIINLPDVKDIPGQEFVHPPPLGMMADTTISSDDEEGVGVLDSETPEDDPDINLETDSDVTPDERRALERAETYMPTVDENNLHNATMDNTDFEGTPLNERSFGAVQTGRDLDIPEDTDETRTTAMGQGDEENKYFSNREDNLNQGLNERGT